MLAGRDRRRAAGSGLVTGLGLSFLAIHVNHAFLPTTDTWSFIFGILLPTLMSSTLVAIGIMLMQGRTMGSALLIGIWSLVGAVTASLAGFLISLYQLAEGASLTHVTYVISNVATYGGIMGVIIGVYNAKQAATAKELSSEQTRATSLSNRLTVLNRVLRHDIRTNVTIIQGNATQILEGEKPPEEAADTIRDQAINLYRMSEQGRRLEQILAAEGPNIESIDIAEIAERCLADTRELFPEATIESDLPASAIAHASPMIDAAIENILRNGIEHNPNDPYIYLEGRVTDDEVILYFHDNGSGIPESELEVLDRGEETTLEHASGLGLWLTNWVISSSDGSLSFDESPEGGTEICVTLPRP